MARAKRHPPLAFRAVDAPYSRLGVPETPPGGVPAKGCSSEGWDNALAPELGEAALAFLLLVCV
jgi:hypothetical protein